MTLHSFTLAVLWGCIGVDDECFSFFLARSAVVSVDDDADGVNAKGVSESLSESEREKEATLLHTHTHTLSPCAMII